MPRRDGTGPLGRGAVDGRGLGFCTNTNAVRYGAGIGAGFMGLGFGNVCRRGLGRGLGNGLGRGFGRNLISNQTVAETQKELLTAQKEILETRINAISKQLQNL